jgi:hypothetical protein
VAKPETEPGEERTQEDYLANNIPAPSSVSAQEKHIELLIDIMELCSIWCVRGETGLNPRNSCSV